MFKKFWKEILLAAVLTMVLFTAMDFVGNIFVPETPEDLTLSGGIMLFSIIALFLPPLVGCIPSGYLIAKKTKDIKDIIFLPALGAAIGGLVLMLFSTGALLLMTDAAWQTQMDELADYGVEFFATMSLADYKSMVIASVIFSSIFIAVLNFAIGLAGGFVGSKLVKKK